MFTLKNQGCSFMFLFFFQLKKMALRIAYFLHIYGFYVLRINSHYLVNRINPLFFLMDARCVYKRKQIFKYFYMNLRLNRVNILSI
jgi:hypothetical protein